MKFEFTQDDRATQDWFDRLSKKLADLTPVMKAVAHTGEVGTEERFATETDPAGSPWKESNRKREKGGKTLTDQGHLGDSISSSYGKDFAEWGVGMEYGAIHQLGFSGSVNIPAHERVITQAFGMPIQPTTVKVKAHTRMLTIVERAFLARNVDELDVEVIEDAFAAFLEDM